MRFWRLHPGAEGEVLGLRARGGPVPLLTAPEAQPEAQDPVLGRLYMLLYEESAFYQEQ